MQALAGKMRGRIVPADDATGSGDGAARNSGGGGDDVLYVTLPVPSGAKLLDADPPENCCTLFACGTRGG